MARDAENVVIVGGGLAAQRCCERLRSRGYDGRIRVVSEERAAPYDRPPLSKKFLTESNQSVPRFRDDEWYEKEAVELILGKRAKQFLPDAKEIKLSTGESLAYGKLLIATGSRPRRLQLAEGYENVHYLRTLEDATGLNRALLSGAHLVVIGAGFIGQEIAASARTSGCEVTLIEQLEHPLENVLGSEVGSWFGELHRQEGVTVNLGSTVVDLKGNERVEEVILSDGRSIACDAVAIGIGVVPATEWLAGSDLSPHGVLASASGATVIPDVFAAGDAARLFDRRTLSFVRTEHWEAAASQGMAVAESMLGVTPRQQPLSSFWSDQYGVRIQYIGNRTGGEEIEIDGDPEQRNFSAVFHRAGRRVAALLVGRPQELPRLRQLINQGEQYAVSTAH